MRNKWPVAPSKKRTERGALDYSKNPSRICPTCGRKMEEKKNV